MDSFNTQTLAVVIGVAVLLAGFAAWLAWGAAQTRRLRERYPVADFELRAADLSVHHPVVVNNYRAAQRIVSLDQRGEATTEDLRKAVMHFRALFDELLGATRDRGRTSPPARLAA